MASSDKELEQQLAEAGNKLLNPPSSVDELLSLLDKIENCLAKVEQSPSKSMQTALAPSVKALVADQLFKHADADVKVAVACCISEITRITAPEAPYDDDQMKDVFQLIVSSFQNLSDKSSRSYSKRTSILETVAKVRSCVVMLDLECDALIVEMFQHFLGAIRDYHPDNVFVSMETIMTLVLEESEDISAELLSPLLATLKKSNEDALPIARKLAEKVLETCVSKVKPYLQHAVRSLGASADDYSDVVASICQEPSSSIEQNASLTADENKVEETKPVETSPDDGQAKAEVAAEAGSPKSAEPTNDKSPKSAVSNGVAQACEDESLADSTSLKKQDDNIHADPDSNADISTGADPKSLDAEKLANEESKPEGASKKKGRKVNSSTKSAEPSEKSNAEKDVQDPVDDKAASKDITISPHEETAAEAAVSSENIKDAENIQSSSPKAVEGDSVTVSSPSESENLPKAARSKKEKSIKDAEPSAADVSGKTLEGTSDSEAKPNKRSKKEISSKDSEPSADAAGKKTSEGISDSEVKVNKRSSKKTPGKISNEEKTSKSEASKKETTGESETKSPKKPSKKVGESSNNGDKSSLTPVENKKQPSRGKSSLGKNVSKSSTKDDNKASSPKSAARSTKNLPQSETPKTGSKRKRTTGKEKASETQDDDASDLVGKRVKVYWPDDDKFYKGTVDSYNASNKKHKVLYDDGDTEILNLKNETWEFVQDGDDDDDVQDEVAADEPESSDAHLETPPKKKSKTGGDQSSKGKAKSAKGRGASSSKPKTPPAKSTGKSKDSKPTDESKAARKPETETKTGTKSADVSSKSKTKSKTEDASTSKSTKPKEDKTPKTSKQETPKTGKSKQDTANKSSKTTEKSKPTSKAKVPVDDDSTDSDEPLEATKAKSKSQSGKKRRRV